jgi:hypothetical protein
VRAPRTTTRRGSSDKPAAAERSKAFVAIVVDSCERVHVAFATGARDSFTEFAGVSLSPAGAAQPYAHTFIGVMRSSDASMIRLDRIGPTSAGFFGLQAMTLLPDGRHAIKSDLSGTTTVEGVTFTTPDNMIDQFAAALSF